MGGIGAKPTTMGDVNSCFVTSIVVGTFVVCGRGGAVTVGMVKIVVSNVVVVALVVEAVVGFRVTGGEVDDDVCVPPMKLPRSS